jgi:hypothetical protein
VPPRIIDLACSMGRADSTASASHQFVPRFTARPLIHSLEKVAEELRIWLLTAFVLDLFTMTVSTLGEAHDLGWRITVRCAWGRREAMKSRRECVYTAELDLPTLIWTRARDMPLTGLEQRLKCPRCGSRRVAVLFTPPAQPVAAVASPGR